MHKWLPADTLRAICLHAVVRVRRADAVTPTGSAGGCARSV